MQCCTATASGLSNRATIWLSQPISIQQGTDIICTWKDRSVTVYKEGVRKTPGNFDGNIDQCFIRFFIKNDFSIWYYRNFLAALVRIYPPLELWSNVLTSFVMRSIVSEGYDSIICSRRGNFRRASSEFIFSAFNMFSTKWTGSANRSGNWLSVALQPKRKRLIEGRSAIFLNSVSFYTRTMYTVSAQIIFNILECLRPLWTILTIIEQTWVTALNKVCLNVMEYLD